MAWTCPTCGRKFDTERHYHSCEVVDLEIHLSKCDSSTRLLTEKLLTTLSGWKNVQINPLKSCINVSAGANFLSIKTRKSWLEIEFILDEIHDEFPVYKTMRYSKNKVVHFVKAETPDEIRYLIDKWIKPSHAMTIK